MKFRGSFRDGCLSPWANLSRHQAAGIPGSHEATTPAIPSLRGESLNPRGPSRTDRRQKSLPVLTSAASHGNWSASSTWPMQSARRDAERRAGVALRGRSPHRLIPSSPNRLIGFGNRIHVILRRSVETLMCGLFRDCIRYLVHFRKTRTTSESGRAGYCKFQASARRITAGLSRVVSFRRMTLASSHDVRSLGPTDDFVDDCSD